MIGQQRTDLECATADELALRGLGDFQRAQMRDTDTRVHDLFKHLREVLEILEQLMLHPRTPNVPKPTERPKFNQHVGWCRFLACETPGRWRRINTRFGSHLA